MSTLDLDLARAVRGVDALLRSHQGIEEFSDDPDCVFRISREKAVRPLTLSDGVTIQCGEPVIQVHLWNERLPVMSREGRSAIWANLLKRRMRHSFGLIANHLEHEPHLREIVAIRGTPPFPERMGPVPLTRVCEHLGWEIVAPEAASGWPRAWLDSMLIYGLIWAFQPAGLRHRGVAHGRIDVWMSRGKLIRRYGLRRDAGDLGPARRATGLEQS